MRPRHRRLDPGRRLFNLLSRLYPADFRKEYGADLRQAFEDRRTECQHRGFGGRLRLWRLLLEDCLRSSWELRRRAHPVSPVPQNGEQLMESVVNDLRFAIRSFAHRPLFFLLATLTLALGVGANSSVFSVVNGVLLTPFPYRDTDRLVRLFEANPEQGYTRFSFSPPNFLDWRDQSTSFEDMAAFQFASATLTRPAEPVRVQTLRTSADLFAVLGVDPVRGRLFEAAEERDGADRVAVVSFGFWQRALGGTTGVIGMQVVLDDVIHEIVGVMPAGFYFPSPQTDLWVPAALPEFGRGAHALSVVARLRDGVGVEAAHTEVVGIAARLAQAYPDSNAGWTAELVPLASQVIGDADQTLLLLWCAVSLVTLIACVNVANLMLVRALGRGRELALRGALGAGRGRILRQLLTEALAISTVGGAAGLLLAQWAVSWLMADILQGLPRNQGVAVDTRVVLFTVGLSLLAAVVCVLLPAFTVLAGNPVELLRHGRSAARSVGRRWTRPALVVGEVAAALILLIGAVLMISSLRQLFLEDPGFNPDRTVSFALGLPQAGYPEAGHRVEFYRSLVEAVDALPGVESAAAVGLLPMAGASVWAYQLEGAPDVPMSEWPSSQYRVATPGHFQTLGIPLLSGRDFDIGDHQDSRLVCVVSESFARRHFSGSDPIGKRIHITNRTEGWVQIVGVAGDVRTRALDTAAEPVIYAPHSQNAFRFMNVVARTRSEPLALFDQLRAEVRRLDANIPLFAVRQLEDVVTNSVANRRTPMVLLASFAGTALLLTLVGVYGVMGESVRQRQRDFGVMLALGATRRDLVGLTLRRGTLLTVAGIGIGLIGALVLTRFLASLLYGVSPTEPAVYLMVVAIVLIAALTACWLPARRAGRVDPLVTLRAD